MNTNFTNKNEHVNISSSQSKKGYDEKIKDESYEE
jgi:hypothetical protein